MVLAGRFSGDDSRLTVFSERFLGSCFRGRLLRKCSGQKVLGNIFREVLGKVLGKVLTGRLSREYCRGTVLMGKVLGENITKFIGILSPRESAWEGYCGKALAETNVGNFNWIDLG